MSRDFKIFSEFDLRSYGQLLSLFNFNVGYKVKNYTKIKL